MLTLNSTTAMEALQAVKGAPGAGTVRIATFDLGPDVLRAVHDGRLMFAVDQQAYLQGYLPVVLLTQRARYGLFPDPGRGHRDRPALRHAGQRGAGDRAQPPLDPLSDAAGGALSCAPARGTRRSGSGPPACASRFVKLYIAATSMTSHDVLVGQAVRAQRVEVGLLALERRRA